MLNLDDRLDIHFLIYNEVNHSVILMTYRMNMFQLRTLSEEEPIHHFLAKAMSSLVIRTEHCDFQSKDSHFVESCNKKIGTIDLKSMLILSILSTIKVACIYITLIISRKDHVCTICET